MKLRFLGAMGKLFFLQKTNNTFINDNIKLYILRTLFILQVIISYLGCVGPRAATSIRVLTNLSKESSTNNHHFRNRWIAIFVRNCETIHCTLTNIFRQNKMNNEVKVQFSLWSMVIDYKMTYPEVDIKLIF